VWRRGLWHRGGVYRVARGARHVPAAGGEWFAVAHHAHRPGLESERAQRHCLDGAEAGSGGDAPHPGAGAQGRHAQGHDAHLGALLDQRTQEPEHGEGRQQHRGLAQQIGEDGQVDCLRRPWRRLGLQGARHGVDGLPALGGRAEDEVHDHHHKDEQHQLHEHCDRRCNAPAICGTGCHSLPRGLGLGERIGNDTDRREHGRQEIQWCAECQCRKWRERVDHRTGDHRQDEAEQPRRGGAPARVPTGGGYCRSQARLYGCSICAGPPSGALS